MNIRTLIIALACMLLAGACGKKELPSTIAYRSYDTECLGSDPSGRMRLRVWGEGKDQKAAEENARKKAVEDVVFGHITRGNGCNSMPVLDNPSARRIHREYFNKFFKDGGKYKKYIKAEKPEKDARFIGNDRVVQPMEITVDREGLIDRFIKDKILDK